MKKKKIILLAAAGVAVVLMLAAGFLLYRGVVKLNNVQTELSRADSELDRLYGRDPFPSEANVKIERASVDLLNTWKRKLTNELTKGQVVPDREKSPSAFISTLTEKVSKLTDQAKRLHPDTVADNFAFGFDRYFTADGARPEPPHVPRLTQQLLIVEGLTKVLLEEKIDKIVAIKREEFEATDRRGGTDLSNVGVIGETNLFAKLHFTFDVMSRETTLLDVMNRFAKHDQFVVITSVQMNKSAPDVKNRAMELSASLDEDEEDTMFAAITPKGGLGAATNMMTRAERLVSGLDLEKPMSVSLDVDVYWFRAAEEEKREE